jgi:hypothetical protein
MKKLYIPIILLSFLITFISCDQNESNDFSTPEANSGWLEFRTAASELLDNVATAKIPIDLTAGTNLNGIQITYKAELISGTSNGSFGTFTTNIAPGEGLGEIVFNVSPTSENYEVKFTLMSADDANFGIGLSDGSKIIVHTIKVCSTEVSIGTYDGVPTAFSAAQTPFTTTLAATATANEYLIADAWGPFLVADLTGNPGFIGAFPYSGTLTINADYTVVIVGDAGWSTGGAGNYDPCTKTFTYNLTQALFANPFTVDVVLIAQ